MHQTKCDWIPTASKAKKLQVRKPKRFDTSAGMSCRHMTVRVKGLCCAIKGFKHPIAFRLHSRKFFMHEFHYAKEHVIARTFHKAFRLIEKYLLFGLMVAVALKAQQSSPSAPASAGAVRTAAAEPV